MGEERYLVSMALDGLEGTVWYPKPGDLPAGIAFIEPERRAAGGTLGAENVKTCI